MQKPKKNTDLSIIIRDLENQVSAMMKLYHLKNFEFVASSLQHIYFWLHFFLIHVGIIDKKVTHQFSALKLEHIFKIYFLLFF